MVLMSLCLMSAGTAQIANIRQTQTKPVALENGRAGEIRTHDLLHPMQAFYQAELRPDLFAGLWSPAGTWILAFTSRICN